MKIDFTSWRICFLACVNRKDIQRHKINEVEIKTFSNVLLK